MLAQHEEAVSQNFQALSPGCLKNYQVLMKSYQNITALFMPQIVNIGKL
jgi:hypothetical protein